jgi:hypothetical protein
VEYCIAASAGKIPAMIDPIRHYKLLATALPAGEERIRTAYVPTLLLVLAVTTAVFIFLGTSKGAAPRSMIQFGVLMVAYMAYVAFWSPLKMKRRLKRCWETYELEIGHDYLLRRQADLPDLRLDFSDVQAVEHVPGRYLRVIGKPKKRVLAIPEGVEDFDQILKAVSAVRTVRVQNIQQWQKYRVFMAAGLILYVTMLWSTSPPVVIPLSLVMGSVIAWVFFWVRGNPNITSSTKRIVWVYLLFLLMCALKLFVAVSSYLPQHPPRQ